MKPTPEEKCSHDWKWATDDYICRKCNTWRKAMMPSPSPEARCDVHAEQTQGCQRCFPPSPEARVDWEKEADDIIEGFMADGGEVDGDWVKSSGSSLYKRIAKALSAAFEKGREAR
jgi:hypothetical protein